MLCHRAPVSLAGMQAIEWWEKAADDAMRAGMDQAQALRFFQKVYHMNCSHAFANQGVLPADVLQHVNANLASLQLCTELKRLL